VGSIGFVKLLAFYKEIIVAATLSVSLKYDVFLFYLALIGFPTAVLLNPLQSIVIKKIARIRRTNKRAADLETKYISSVVIGLALFLPLAYFCWFSIFDYLIISFGAGKNLQAGNYSISVWYFAPYAVFSALNIILYGYFQSKSQFLMNGFTQAATPIITILLLKNFSSTELTLLAGISLGAIFESVIMLRKIFKNRILIIAPFAVCISILFKLMNDSKGLILGFFTTSITPLFESILLFSSRVGDMSTYSFGSKLPSAISSVLVTSAAITSLPILSSYFAVQTGRTALKKYFFWVCAGVMVTGCLTALLLSFFSTDILKLVFRSAHFTDEVLLRMSQIQTYLFFQVPFAVLSIIASKALVAAHKNYTVSFIMIGGALAQSTALAYFNKSLEGPQIALFSLLFSIGLSVIYFSFACIQIYRSST
jgi:putative peptidoglycan lipid II flippase